MTFDDLASRRREHVQGGGRDKQDDQRKKNKLNAQERVSLLFDSDSFVELDQFVLHECNEFGMDKKRILGDGVITGYGTIDGRQVYSFLHDFTVFGGSL